MTELLKRTLVEKPWGQLGLPPVFNVSPGQRIGEIWFERTACPLSLMLKFLFTDENLSVQVHPSDSQARQRGLPSGKEECWLILDAAPDARLAIGLKQPCDADTLRRAAQSGAIMEMLEWVPVSRGDFFYVPAGTIHAIGAGVTLVEVQQNADITYRLFDYGRPRELHLEDGIAVATAAPYDHSLYRHVDLNEDAMLVTGPKFSLMLCGQEISSLAGVGPYLVTPLSGTTTCAGITVRQGQFLASDEIPDLMNSPDARLLVARACV